MQLGADGPPFLLPFPLCWCVFLYLYVMECQLLCAYMCFGLLMSELLVGCSHVLAHNVTMVT